MRIPRRTRIFALLTLGLVVAGFGYSFWRHQSHAAERHAWTELTGRIAVHRTRIDSIEGVLAAGESRVDQARDRLGRMNARIEHYESRAVDGRLPGPDYRRYLTEIERQNALVERHNSRLAELQRTYAEYSTIVDEFNALVDSANTLQRRAVEEGFDLPATEEQVRNRRLMGNPDSGAVSN